MRSRQGITSTLAAAVLSLLAIAFPNRSRAAEPVIRPAIDGIFAAFETHPLVGLGDVHGLANALGFYAKLVRDPRFATQVGNATLWMDLEYNREVARRGEIRGYPLMPFAELVQFYSGPIPRWWR